MSQVNVEKLVKISEGKSNKEYKQFFREEVLGIAGNKIDASKASANANEFSLQEVAHSFLGRNFEQVLRDNCQRIQEADGNSISAAQMQNINAFNATVAGLVDAMVMEAYNYPGLFGDELVTVVPRRTNGGKMILPAIDGTLGTNLGLTEKYPTASIGEMYVNVPNTIRNGVAIQIGLSAFLFDLTGEVQSLAQEVGFSVRRNREINIAKTCMGVTNTYAFNGVSSNTYGTAVGTPAYTNLKASNALVDYKNIENLLLILRGNTHPVNGYEIDPSMNLSLIVPPALEMTARRILTATSLRSGDGASSTIATYSSNPLPNGIKLYSSQIWRNQVASDTTWFLGDFKKGVKVAEHVPFTVEQSPIGFEQARQDVVYSSVAKEWSVPFVAEPRMIGKATA